MNQKRPWRHAVCQGRQPSDMRDHTVSHQIDHRPPYRSHQAATKTSKSRLSRDFWSSSIFDFCNSTANTRHADVRPSNFIFGEFSDRELGAFTGKLAALKSRLEKARLKVAMGIDCRHSLNIRHSAAALGSKQSESNCSTKPTRSEKIGVSYLLTGRQGWAMQS